MKTFEQAEQDFYPQINYYNFEELGVTNNPKQKKEFREVQRKQDFIERIYSVDNERSNIVFCNEPEDPSTNKINFLMMNDNFPIEDSFTQNSNIIFKPSKYYQSDQRVNTRRKQLNEFIEIPRKQDFTKNNYSFEKEKRNAVFFKDLTDPSIIKVNYMMMKNDFPTKDSFTQYSETDQNLAKYHQSDNRITINPKEIKEFLQVPIKQDFTTEKYSLGKEKKNSLFFNDSTNPCINKINNVMMKNDLPTKDCYTQYSNIDLKSGKYKCQKTTPEVSQQYTRTCNACKEKHLRSSLPEYYTQLIPKVTGSRTQSPLSYLRRRENSSYSRSNIIQGACKNSRSQNFSSNHQMRHETFSDIDCVKNNNNNNHIENRKYFVNLESKPFTIGKTYSTRSQNSETQSELQLKKKKPKAIDSMFREKPENEPNKKVPFCPNTDQRMNYQNSQTVLHDQVKTWNNNLMNVHKAHSFSNSSDKIQNKLQQKNKRHKLMDNMFCGMKSEPKPTNKFQIGTNENQAMKYQNSNSAVHKPTLTCNNSFPNVLKEYAVQKKISEQKCKAYDEAINYTEYLIQKLSEKNSKISISEEEKMKSQRTLCNSSGSSEEKCTQTFRAAQNEKTKNLIFKEKITQTIG